MTGLLASGGLMRAYLLYLPPDYRSMARTPLVLNFHGHSGNPFTQQGTSGFTTLARTQGFIVVYPWGTSGSDGRMGWSTGLPGHPHTNDVLFVSDLLNHLQAMLCIDPQRIYATGFSNGGGMTNLLACQLSRRIAAFAPVSGSYPPLPGGCRPQRPVPILEFHGTADPTVRYTGNPRLGEPPIPLWLQQWSRRDGCTQSTSFYRTRRIVGVAWTHCQGNAIVIGYRILGEGHRWPHLLINLQPDSNVSTASQVIWSFFQAHPLPALRERPRASVHPVRPARPRLTDVYKPALDSRLKLFKTLR
jgi:polyhydroxybutyrate depolymerase